MFTMFWKRASRRLEKVHVKTHHYSGLFMNASHFSCSTHKNRSVGGLLCQRSSLYPTFPFSYNSDMDDYGGNFTYGTENRETATAAIRSIVICRFIKHFQGWKLLKIFLASARWPDSSQYPALSRSLWDNMGNHVSSGSFREVAGVGPVSTQYLSSMETIGAQ